MTEHSAPETPGGPVGRLKAWRYEAETRLAPHVERAWAESFVLELRLRDVPGRALGDALAEVESHCAESGETALEAFGDPVAYAVSLELPTEPVNPLTSRAALRWTVQTIGLLVTTAAATSWQAGEPLEVTAGLVALVAVLAVTVVGLGRVADKVLRFVVEHTVVAWLLSMVHVAVLIGLMLWLRQVLVSLPAPPTLAVGVALLAVGTVFVLRDLGDDDLDDPVRASFEEAEDPVRASRRTAALRYGPAFLAPLTAVALVGIGLVLG